MMDTAKKLSIAFYWHMHQPVYQLSPAGDYLMPWVRLHAVKDYLDMVLILEKYKNIRLNFNLVPVLLDALIDYGEKGLHDIHSRLSIKDTDELTNDDKFFIINNFFDSNYEHMILPNETYNRLYRRYTISEHKDTDIFSLAEYSDLMALFNLAWIDPVHKDTYPELKALVEKGRGYATEDRIKIIEIQRDIIRKIIPAYRRFIENGKIEVTTSPYYHPILPVMLEKPDLKDDACPQVATALERVEELLGKRPRGMWPSEQAISRETLDLFAQQGLEWTISDEGILSESINFEFVRDFKGYPEDPYLLLKTYKYNDMKLVFRDSGLANLISFEYYNRDSKAAANDLYDRIKVVQSKLLSSHDENHLLTIAMDGENCWENYPADGSVFLNTIYSLIENDPSLETVLFSDYVAKDTPKPLNKIASGSWVNRNFNLWINEPVKDLAWSALSRVKADFADFVRKNPGHAGIEAVQREIFICEGSDWFWWYGEPNDSGHDYLFDYIFREHLKNVYIYLELEAPEFLENPLNPIAPASGDEEWLNAGCVEIPDGPVIKENKVFDKICFGSDNDNLYFRFFINPYLKETVKNNDRRAYQIYLYLRNQGSQPLSPVRIISKTENVLPLEKEKFRSELQITLVNGEVYTRLARALNDDLWTLVSNKEITSASGRFLDISIPFASLETEQGGTVEFMFVCADYGVKDCLIPNDILLTVKRQQV